MFSHVTIGSSDPDKAADFYDAVLGTLGISRPFEGPGFAAYGELTGSKTFIVKPFDGDAHIPGNGGHTAYLAKTRAEVDAFHAAALKMDGTCEGPPGQVMPCWEPWAYRAHSKDRDLPLMAS